MQCPKCGHAQADGLTECQRCGVIFAKIPRTPAAGLGPARLHPTAADDDAPAIEDPATDRPAPLAAIAVALTVLVAALWWLNFPRGGSLGDAAQVDAEKGYAFRPPADWLVLTPSNYEQMLKPYQNRFPKELRRFIDKARFDISFWRMPEREGDFAPSINLIAMPLKGQLPPLNENEKDKAAEAISGQMSKLIDTYRLQNSRIVEVDGLKALQLSSTASLRVIVKPAEAIYSEPGAFGLRQAIGRTEEESRQFDMKSVQTFVPGKHFGYLLSCNFEAADPHDSEATCRRVVDSFRVTDRPPRFGRIAMGALNGGLIAAAGFLAWLLLRRLASR